MEAFGRKIELLNGEDEGLGNWREAGRERGGEEEQLKTKNFVDEMNGS